MSAPQYDAVLFVSFGGPERREDVLPFLENVVRGKPVPRERLLEVADQYYALGGKSPINEQNRALIAALKAELEARGPNLPIYFGNRNWHPMLADTLKLMADDGVKHALAFVTSAFSSFSGCRQYRDNIEEARARVGMNAPTVDKLRVYYNHPGFIEPMAERVRSAFALLPAEKRETAKLIFTAHSIPLTMAQHCDYEAQLREACELVASRVGCTAWQLAYESRSGAPHVPWLEPDILDALAALAHEAPGTGVVVAPIGFISDHMEVVIDLDHKAKIAASDLGLTFVRAATVGAHPRFVSMIRELVAERTEPSAPKLALGTRGPNHDVCPTDCCLYPVSTRPAARAH